MAVSTALRRSGKKVAFLFGEDGPSSAAVLGGKGAGLAELARFGAPVPPGFTITTSVARAFAQHKRMPERVERHMRWQIAAVEKQTGLRFGDAVTPMLVSVRSGAQVSMPGMMDTVLNLGNNLQITRRIAEVHGAEFAWACYKRFLRMFGEVVLGIEAAVFDECDARVRRIYAARDSALHFKLEDTCHFYINAIKSAGKCVPEDPWQQLRMAVEAVLRSWNSPRARVYRNVHGISNNLGTAVNVQAMVYGNRDERSATGVVFSHNIVTGEPGLTGEFLVKAQGEDVVAGVVTPQPIAALAKWNKSVYAQLKQLVEQLAETRDEPVDVEFTVESGKLYTLQVRNAKLAAAAAITLATRKVWEGKLTKQQALARITRSQFETVRSREFDESAVQRACRKHSSIKGIAASPGAAVGRVVRSSGEAVSARARGEDVVLVTDMTTPDDLPGMLAAVAIVTANGGSSSHAAIVACELGKPAVVGCGRVWDLHGIISVDGTRGIAVNGVVEAGQAARSKEINIFTRWYVDAERAEAPKPKLNTAMYRERKHSLLKMAGDFYLTREMAKAAKGTALEAEATKLKTQIHREAAERVATYLFSAIAGEVRHAQNKGLIHHDERREHNIDVVRYSAELKLLESMGVTWKVEGGDDERLRVQQDVLEVCESLPHSKHVQFAETVYRVFNQPWRSSSFGGPKWANIAMAVKSFLTGEMLTTVFVDHAFDLQHNGGVLFNKNDMFDWLKEEGELKKLLDAKQRLSDVGSLHRSFTVDTRGYGIGTLREVLSRPLARKAGALSPNVEELYQKGAEKGLWSEPQPMSAVQLRDEYDSPYGNKW